MEGLEKGLVPVETREEIVNSSLEVDIVNPDSVRSSWLKTVLKVATNVNPLVKILDLGVRDGLTVVCVLNPSSRTI